MDTAEGRLVCRGPPQVPQLTGVCELKTPEETPIGIEVHKSYTGRLPSLHERRQRGGDGTLSTKTASPSYFADHSATYTQETKKKICLCVRITHAHPPCVDMM